MLTEATVKTGRVHRTRGKDLLRSLSRSISIDHYFSVLELVTNCHDADAERVTVRYDEGLEELLIEDDGTGMNRKTIHHFFEVGTSDKRKHPISEKGREKIGKFGIASILVEELGNEYTIETWRDKEKITVSGTVPEEREQQTQLRVSYEKVKDQSHGTRIRIRKPNFKWGSVQLNLAQLISRMEWELPNLPDFNITVNGEEVTKRATVTYTTEYDVTKELGGKLRLRGSIYVRDRTAGPMKHGAGIYLYVKNRAVCGPREFPVDGPLKRLNGQVLGEIHVGGMDDKIQFDRTGFIQGKLFTQARNYVMEVLRSIQYDFEWGMGSRRYYQTARVTSQIENALEAAQKELNTKLGFSGGNKYRFELDFGERSGHMATADSTERVIYINATHPSLIKPQRGIQTILQNSFLGLTIGALANLEVTDSMKKSAAILRMIDEETTKVAAVLFRAYEKIENDMRTAKRPGDDVALDTVRISPYRLYTPQDLAHTTGMDVNTAKLLIISGALRVHRSSPRERKVLGSEVSEFLTGVDGYVPAAQVVAPEAYRGLIKRYSERYIPQVDEILVQHLRELPYARNVGVDHPFIWVKRSEVRKLKAYTTKLKRGSE
ncbi:MAG: ATP-binding protein [Nanoarchaeota archaeon]